MKEILRKEIMPNVRLTHLQTDKFKTGVFSATILTGLDRENASKNALLPYVLRRGTALHNDMDSIAALLDDAYGAVIEPVVRKKGETHCIGFYADFADDFFLNGKESVLEKVIGLTAEIMTAPATKSGTLLHEYVDGEKNRLLDELEAQVNDKRSYVLSRSLELMCAKENYGINRLGRESQIKKVTAAGLTKHYRRLIAGAPIELFYCGSAGYDRVENAVLEAFAALPRTGFIPIPQTEILTRPVKSEPRVFIDRMDVGQGKLVIGFRMGEAALHPNHPAVLVFNALYGGAPTSKLFVNVRERMSLCYYASSQIDRHKGVMLVSSGIEFNKYEVAKNEILAQLEAIKDGDISEAELESAKKTVMNAYKASMDSQSSLEGTYLDNCLSDIRYSPDVMAALVYDVTKKDVMDVAAGVCADAVYFLTGNGGDTDES